MHKQQNLDRLKIRNARICDLIRFNPETEIWTVSQSYFYRAGRSAQDLAHKVEALFGDATEIVDVVDRWVPYPKNSTFIVRFVIKRSGKPVAGCPAIDSTTRTSS